MDELIFVRGGRVKTDSVVNSSDPVLSIDDFVVSAHLIVFKELEASQLYMADIPVLLLPLLDKTDDTS